MTDQPPAVIDVSEARQVWEFGLGLGMMHAKRAVTIAHERFGGDLKLGALWVHAAGFAVYVKGDRAAWNERWARANIEMLS